MPAAHLTAGMYYGCLDFIEVIFMKTLYYVTVDNGAESVTFSTATFLSIIDFVNFYLGDYLGMSHPELLNTGYFAAIWDEDGGVAGFSRLLDFLSDFHDADLTKRGFMKIMVPNGAVKVHIERDFMEG